MTAVPEGAPGRAPVRFSRNPFRQRRLADAAWPPEPGVRAFHRALPGYAPTPLVPLPGLARKLGMRELVVKDESHRFGLDAFKALGASYAIHRVMESDPKKTSWTFATATDGNHGRAVAWSARRLGQRAVIFVPASMVPARVAAIGGEGAEVIAVAGTYDDTVKRAAEESARNGWQVVSDTAYDGYTEVPRWIMEGYSTLFAEIEEAWPSALGADRPRSSRSPDAVLLQAGVGGLACAGTLWYRRLGRGFVSLISVEPADADCLLESITSPDGSIRAARGRQESIMAGLNCGTPSLLAWPVIRAGMDAFVAVGDGSAVEAMRLLAAGTGGDPKIVAGEAGAAGLAGLLALLELPPAERAPLRVNGHVLLVNTEGDTDPANYRRIVGG